MTMKILLADNAVPFLEVQSRLLEMEGYEVLKAATVEKAEWLLEERWVHLAILDIRMLDEDDEQDISGLLLAQKEKYRPVRKIILTAYPSYEYVREALGLTPDGLPPAVSFLAKDEGPEALIQAVERAFAQHVRIDWDLVIRWGEQERLSFPHLVTLIEPGLEAARLPDQAGELEDLLRKLFYEKNQITIGWLLWYREERVCMTVFTHSQEGVLEQYIVTCGLRPRIEQEINRYKEFAPKGGIGIALASFAETTHFAAITYALSIGADLEQIQTFGVFYQTSKAAQVSRILEHLFQNTLASWHQAGRILEETKNLGQLYRQCLNLSEISHEQLKQRMEPLAREALSLGPTTIELSADELTLRFPAGDTVSYLNPIPHIYEEVAGSGLPVVCRITPGTLTGDNILVDQNGRTWLADFAQAGPAPLLWDFISLEAMIRFDLTESTELQSLHEFEKRLVAPVRLNERLDAQDIDPQFRKALGGIQEIRRQAFSVVGADPTSYYTGLFFHAVRRMAGYTPDLRHTRQELARPVHALLAAAMIWRRITQMVDEISSKDSSSATPGIEIDEANRQVWVEGRQVALSPTEFDVLLHFYNHAGQLCQRRSIVEEGLRGTYTGNEQEESRINTIMGRLRKKTEPDPDHPRYILTVRGEGYMLCLGDENRS